MRVLKLQQHCQVSIMTCRLQTFCSDIDQHILLIALRTTLNRAQLIKYLRLNTST